MVDIPHILCKVIKLQMLLISIAQPYTVQYSCSIVKLSQAITKKAANKKRPKKNVNNCIVFDLSRKTFH